MKTKKIEHVVEAWHLQYQSGTSNKFYEVLLSDNGLCVLRWGKIGTRGQHSITRYQTYDQARDVAMRQVYAKKSKGYGETFDYKFTCSQDVLDEVQRENLNPVLRALTTAREEGAYAGTRDAVLKHYTEFAANVQAALHTAGQPDSDYIEVMGQLEGIESVWEDINAKHGEVEAAMSLLKMTLAQRLMAAP